MVASIRASEDRLGQGQPGELFNRDLVTLCFPGAFALVAASGSLAGRAAGAAHCPARSDDEADAGAPVFAHGRHPHHLTLRLVQTPASSLAQASPDVHRVQPFGLGAWGL